MSDPMTEWGNVHGWGDVHGTFVLVRNTMRRGGIYRFKAAYFEGKDTWVLTERLTAGEAAVAAVLFPAVNGPRCAVSRLTGEMPDVITDVDMKAIFDLPSLPPRRNG